MNRAKLEEVLKNNPKVVVGFAHQHGVTIEHASVLIAEIAEKLVVAMNGSSERVRELAEAFARAAERFKESVGDEVWGLSPRSHRPAVIDFGSWQMTRGEFHRVQRDINRGRKAFMGIGAARLRVLRFCGRDRRRFAQTV